MRLAELIMAVVMGLASIAMMVKSAELPIGWIDGEGPGGGAFPFWLAAGMGVCCREVVRSVDTIDVASPQFKSSANAICSQWRHQRREFHHRDEKTSEIFF